MTGVAEAGPGGLRQKTSLYNVARNKLRWSLLVLICLMFFITFLDKASLSATAPLIAKEFQIDKASLGLIFGGFVLASAIGQIPCGFLADRYGPRLMVALFVAAWSLATVATAFAAGFISLLVIRFLTGLGESGAFPGGTRALKPWFTKSEHGFVQGLPHLFGRLGTAVVPLLTIYLSARFGWRGVFMVFGVLGIAWAVVYWLIYRDRPAGHPWISAGEREHLAENERTIARAGPRPAVPWKLLMSAPTTWGLICAAAAYTYCIFFYTTWLPTYLTEHHGISFAKMGLLASLPLFAGMAGDVVGGVLTDAILRRTGRIGFARGVVVVPSFLLAAAALVPAALSPDPIVSVGCLAVSLFFMEMITGPWWAVPLDVGGPFSGTLSGIMNTASNIAGTISPIVFGYLAQSGHWELPFLISAGVLVAGAVAWLLLVRPSHAMFEPAE
jgi:sugar phosphate permease